MTSRLKVALLALAVAAGCSPGADALAAAGCCVKKRKAGRVGSREVAALAAVAPRIPPSAAVAPAPSGVQTRSSRRAAQVRGFFVETLFTVIFVFGLVPIGSKQY